MKNTFGVHNQWLHNTFPYKLQVILPVLVDYHVTVTILLQIHRSWTIPESPYISSPSLHGHEGWPLVQSVQDKASLSKQDTARKQANKRAHPHNEEDSLRYADNSISGTDPFLPERANCCWSKTSSSLSEPPSPAARLRDDSARRRFAACCFIWRIPR